MLFSRIHSLQVISIWCRMTSAVYGPNDCWMIYQVTNRNPVGLAHEQNGIFRKKYSMGFSTWGMWCVSLGELEDFGKNFHTSCHLRVTIVFIQRSGRKKICFFTSIRNNATIMYIRCSDAFFNNAKVVLFKESEAFALHGCSLLKDDEKLWIV